jgi:hypothetical protein
MDGIGSNAELSEKKEMTMDWSTQSYGYKRVCVRACPIKHNTHHPPLANLC